MQMCRNTNERMIIQSHYEALYISELRKKDRKIIPSVTNGCVCIRDVEAVQTAFNASASASDSI